jgi:hypothetical protein
MSNPTFVRVRPNRRIFANRRSISLTRSPQTSPGAVRLTVTLPLAPAARLRPRMGAMTLLLNAKLAFSDAP